MSQWTHVSGCIRIDGLPGMVTERSVRSALGTPSGDHDARVYEEGSNIPGGSEGTLQYAIAKAGDGMVMFTVAVWGDLRDFGAEDVPEIETWFTRVVSGMFIRAAHLLIEVEDGETFWLRARDGVVTRHAAEA